MKLAVVTTMAGKQCTSLNSGAPVDISKKIAMTHGKCRQSAPGLECILQEGIWQEGTLHKE